MNERLYTFEFSGACAWHEPPKMGEAHTLAEMLSMVGMDAVDGGTEFDFVPCRKDGTPRARAKVNRIGIGLAERGGDLHYYAYRATECRSPEAWEVFVSLQRACEKMNADIYA